MRAVHVACALAFGIIAASKASGAGEGAPDAALVTAVLTDSIPSTLRLGTFGFPTREGSIPILMARASVVGGTAFADGARIQGGRANGALTLGLPRGFTVEARGSVLMLDHADPRERRLVRSEARLRRGDAAHGAWLGAAFERSLAGSREPDGVEMGLGVWAAPGAVALALSLEQTNEHTRIMTVLPPDPSTDPTRMDSLPVPHQTVFDDRLVRSTSALVSGRWEHRRLGLESVAGVTFNRYVSPRRWMQATFDVAVRPRLALYATLGSAAPRWLALEPGISRGATLGFKLTGAMNAAAGEAAETRLRAPEFRLRHLGEDWYVIEVRARAAGPVEVIGDFSGWEPQALRHVTGTRWALAMRLAPGVHQIQVRVDGGAWSPPAGLPTASDGFNGDVGVFVAR